MLTDAPPHEGCRGESAIATIGMFERRRWAFAIEATFEPEEVVRVCEPLPSIVVQSIGKPLPGFVNVSQSIHGRPDFEIDLIYDAPWIEVDPKVVPPRLTWVKPQIRVVLCDPSIADGLTQASALPPTDFIITTDSAGLPTLAEALALVLTVHELLICTEFADIRYCSGWAPERRVIGRAIVLAGQGDAAMAAILRTWIEQAALDGFGGGLFLMQLSLNDDKVLLEEFAAFFEEVSADSGDRYNVVTASLDASVAAVVVIAFMPKVILDRS